MGGGLGSAELFRTCNKYSESEPLHCVSLGHSARLSTSLSTRLSTRLSRWLHKSEPLPSHSPPPSPKAAPDRFLLQLVVDGEAYSDAEDAVVASRAKGLMTGPFTPRSVERRPNYPQVPAKSPSSFCPVVEKDEEEAEEEQRRRRRVCQVET